MAITKLTNTQIQTLVNTAYKQMTGKEAMTAEDLSAFSDSGSSGIPIALIVPAIATYFSRTLLVLARLPRQFP